jgi:hypothetical protein
MKSFRSIWLVIQIHSVRNPVGVLATFNDRSILLSFWFSCVSPNAYRVVPSYRRMQPPFLFFNFNMHHLSSHSTPNKIWCILLYPYENSSLYTAEKVYKFWNYYSVMCNNGLKLCLIYYLFLINIRNFVTPYFMVWHTKFSTKFCGLYAQLLNLTAAYKWLHTLRFWTTYTPDSSD